MLFDGLAGPRRKDVQLKSLPPIPETGWRAPAEFPNLSSAYMLALDTETYDPELNEAGPGWARGKGHIVGFSFAAMDRQGNTGKWYFPIRHEVCPEQNLDPVNALAFAKHYLEQPTMKVGANLLYDIGWLDAEDIKVNGPLHDIQFAEAIIDNNAFVGLDVVAHKYLNEYKQSDVLEEWIKAAYKPKKREWRANIYRSPPSLVGPYGESDADLPLRIIQRQWPIIAREGLGTIYDLEHDLIPVLIAMRKEGVTVNVQRAERLRLELKAEIAAMYDRIEYQYGIPLANSDGKLSTDSRVIAKLFKHIGIDTPKTDSGNASIRKEWLAAHDHPAAELVNSIREHEKIVGTFIESYILGKHVNGKLYPSFHPLKGEDNGTMVGRFSSSDPNLQNIPGRTDLGKRVREAFEPDPGHLRWRKNDYSQLHYRELAHFAVDDGDGSADALRKSYIDNPDMDYHDKVKNNIFELTGKDIPRRPIKNINFGLIYGQSEKSLAYKGGFTEQEAKDVFEAYHLGAPYVRPTMKEIAKEAEIHGFVTTLLGRRLRFNLWEPRDWEWRKTATPLTYENALRRYGSFIQLAYLYRAVNYKLQGTEPDIMKSGIVACHKSGVFDYTGVPRITVHDELGFSQRDDSPATREAFDFIKHTMENTVRLRVPVKVDSKTGDNWGVID